MFARDISHVTSHTWHLELTSRELDDRVIAHAEGEQVGEVEHLGRNSLGDKQVYCYCLDRLGRRAENKQKLCCARASRACTETAID